MSTIHSLHTRLPVVCTVYTAHSTVYSVHCTLYSAHTQGTHTYGKMRIKVGKDCEGYMLDCVCSLSELVLELGDWLRFVNKLQILVSVLVSKEVKFSYSIGLEWEREIWKQKKNSVSQMRDQSTSWIL